MSHRIYQMSFSAIFDALVNKVLRKNKTKDELISLITWLTGYTDEQIKDLTQSTLTMQEFFEQAPSLNPKRTLIKGKICGVQIEEITEPLMKEIRYLDKLVDELAKGKTVEQLLNKYQ